MKISIDFKKGNRTTRDHLLFNIDNDRVISYKAYIKPNDESTIIGWVGYELIEKIVMEKDMKNVVLNLRHKNDDIKMLCEEIIANGFEAIKITYDKARGLTWKQVQYKA